MHSYNFRNRLFYLIKPLIPRSLQLFLRRQLAQYNRRKYTKVWPIDPNAGRPPDGWSGWPEGKRFALVLCHDVDSRKGLDHVLHLAALEEQMDVRSQFNFVPERYGRIEIELLNDLKRRGFGIGVHGLKHDGKLFNSKQIFNKRAQRINAYFEEWDTKAFTTPSMIRNHDWMHSLNMEYCVSTFDTDPFEPQSEGACTIFPYWVQRDPSSKGFWELPYTLVQDFTLFILLREKNIDVWKKKIDWIAQKGGMVLLNTHPDYMNFRDTKIRFDEYPADNYRNLLLYLRKSHENHYWAALPKEIADFRKQQSASAETETNPVFLRSL